MEGFIIILKMIEDTVDEESEYLPADNEFVMLARGVADDLLITKNGQPNWYNVEELRHSGYDVFAIERDRFGWLVGGIQTSKGILTFG
jgi:hypothetical protein